MSKGKYTTIEVNGFSFRTSYPEGEKNESTIFALGYLDLSFSNTGSPCSYSPSEAQWNQKTVSSF